MFKGGRCFLGLLTVVTHETSIAGLIAFAFYPVIALERYSLFSRESIFFMYGSAPTSLGVCFTCSYLGGMHVCVVIRGTIGTLDLWITIFIVYVIYIYIHICICMYVCVWDISSGITNDTIIKRDAETDILLAVPMSIAINYVNIVLRYEDEWSLQWRGISLQDGGQLFCVAVSFSKYVFPCVWWRS